MPKISRMYHCEGTRSEQPDPDVVSQVDVGQRGHLVDVPELERTEKVQFGPRKNVPSTMSDDPEHGEAKQEQRNLGTRSLNVKLAVPLRVPVDVGNANQPTMMRARKDDTGEPRVEVHEISWSPGSTTGAFDGFGVLADSPLLQRGLQQEFDQTMKRRCR